MKKEAEDDTNKWKDVHAHGLEGLISLKMSILPEVIYRFNAIPVKNINGVLLRTRTNNPKIYVKPKRPQIVKATWRWKNKAGGITLPVFKLCCKATMELTQIQTQINGSEKGA